MPLRFSPLSSLLRLTVLAAALSVGLAAGGDSHAAARADTAPVPLARQLLAELIAINSTHAHGTTVAAAALAKHFRDAGFDPRDVVELAPADHPEMGNLVVRLRGTGKTRPVLYIGHLDVVEAKPEDWTVDPFVLTEKDGWLYGRGTIDMKGQVAAVAANLIAMKRAGVRPARDIVVAFTADEEAGAIANGVEFLLREHRPLIDAEFAINPDGGEAGMKNGERRYIGVQTGEKIFHTLTLSLTDKGGHSSRPTAANPIVRLARDLAKIADYRFPARLTDTTRAYFGQRAKLEAGQVQADMRSAAGAAPDPAALERLSAVVETSILLRTTCAVTEIAGGHAENALPQRATATVQCRVLPGDDLAGIERQIRAAAGDPELTISIRSQGEASPESPLRPDLVKRIEAVSRALWPTVLVIPQMSPGATDGKYLRSAGIPTYGVDGMFDDLDDGRAHGRDERIGVTAFAEEVDFTGRLMREVSAL
jgi:acetylornithine deacetylase/succinyl-diaminopimelate desuccinylase-like protein